MEFLKFISAKEMYDALIDGPDLYSPTKELLVYHYNVDGAICHYDIDTEKAAVLVQTCIDTGEDMWGAHLGPGGYIIDNLYDGEDVPPAIDYLEDLYKDVWVTTADYAEMLDRGITIEVGDKEKDEEIVVIKDDTIKAVLEDIGEGVCGDYDPEDANDIQLLRFSAYINNDGIFEQMDDASYCTQIPLSTPYGELARLCMVIFEEYRDVADAYRNGSSVKRLGERLSWLSPSKKEAA